MGIEPLWNDGGVKYSWCGLAISDIYVYFLSRKSAVNIVLFCTLKWMIGYKANNRV